MAIQIADDGTQIVTDASGNVQSYTDTDGRVYFPDRSVVSDWLDKLAGVGVSALQRAFNPAPTPQPAATPTAAPRITVATVALVVGALLLAKKFLR